MNSRLCDLDTEDFEARDARAARKLHEVGVPSESTRSVHGLADNPPPAHPGRHKRLINSPRPVAILAASTKVFDRLWDSWE
jgi:hypothetical protein